MYKDDLRPHRKEKALPLAAVVEGIRIRHQKGVDKVHPKLWGGLIDTGADYTVVPEEFIKWAFNECDIPLNDFSDGTVNLSGFDSVSSKSFIVYELAIRIPCFQIEIPIRAISADRKNILLGRDIFCVAKPETLVMNWRERHFLIY